MVVKYHTILLDIFKMKQSFQNNVNNYYQYNLKGKKYNVMFPKINSKLASDLVVRLTLEVDMNKY